MFLFACFSFSVYLGLFCLSCGYGSLPSTCQLPSSPQSHHINIMFTGSRNWQAALSVLLHLFASSQTVFFFFRCLCAQSCVCDTAECAVSPVRWYVWIVIGWLVSLRGSSRSKGRCSGAAVGELEWSPPATALSLWASSSKRCLVAGRRLQAPGALMLGKDAWDTEKRVMCMSVFVCVLWGDPK